MKVCGIKLINFHRLAFACNENEDFYWNLASSNINVPGGEEGSAIIKHTIREECDRNIYKILHVSHPTAKFPARMPTLRVVWNFSSPNVRTRSIPWIAQSLHGIIFLFFLSFFFFLTNARTFGACKRIHTDQNAFVVSFFFFFSNMHGAQSTYIHFQSLLPPMFIFYPINKRVAKTYHRGTLREPRVRWINEIIHQNRNYKNTQINR